jgi:hypothetical protein
VNDGAEVHGVAQGTALVEFAQAIVSNDAAALSRTRQTLTDALGSAAMVDAAGVASNFQRMVRIADGTGIELDDGLARFSETVRAELDLARFLDRKA